MLSDRRGAELVEWVVIIVIALSVVGTAVYALFGTLGHKIYLLNNSIQ
jgi:Flp pilus assembly pilin Flp